MSMADLSQFDVNGAGNPFNNVFGLPFTEEEAQLIILPVPWEVTVSSGTGTSRSAEHICKASLQVDLFDPNVPDGWKKGMFMRAIDKKVLMKSDYLRKEAELFINYISKGDDVSKNKFMCKSLKDINEGSNFLNTWVQQHTQELLEAGKLVVLLGGDHSTTFGYIQSLAQKHQSFGILQIDAHCDLRKAYEGFVYSHASVMRNVLDEIPQVKQLLQVGIRDYCDEEYTFIKESNNRVVTYFDQQIKERQYEGETWRMITDEIINNLPEKIYLSFDIDGLDPKLCPNTGTPVPGGFETEQIFYLVRKLIESGRTLIGLDIVEVGVGDNSIDTSVGARALWRLSNLFIKSNS
jgi:agmatinase